MDSWRITSSTWWGEASIMISIEPMWHARISASLQNSQPKCFQIWLSVPGWDGIRNYSTTNNTNQHCHLDHSTKNRRDFGVSMSCCHARQIVLEHPGCQHCTSAQSGAAQGSLETFCDGGGQSGAVELKTYSPEFIESKLLGRGHFIVWKACHSVRERHFKVFLSDSLWCLPFCHPWVQVLPYALVYSLFWSWLLILR